MNLQRNNSEGDRWLNTTTHLWDGDTLRTTTAPPGPEHWLIRVHWALVYGHATPVGIDIQSAPTAREEPDPDGAMRFETGKHFGKGTPWPGSDAFKAVTRDLFKELPVGQIIREGRKAVEIIWDAIQDRPTPESDRVREALARIDYSNSPSDWKFRKTAETYAEALDDPKTELPRIAIEVHERLIRQVMDAQGSDPTSRLAAWTDLTYARTRKNIVEARRRGYLSPVAKKPDSSEREES